MRSFSILTSLFRVFLVSLIFFGLAGCKVVQDYLGSRKPSARVVNARLADLSLESATMLFDVEVENPYSLPLPLVNVDYALASRDKSFLSGRVDLEGTVPAQGKRTIALPAKVAYTGLLEVLKDVRPGSVIPYTANFGLSVDAPALGPLRLPLRKEGELPIPKVPEVEIRQIRWDKLTLDEAGGYANLQLVNRNEFPLEISQLDYSLSLGGVEVANSSMAESLSFAAGGGGGDLEIPIKFSPRSLGLAVFRMLTAKGAGYDLRGTLDVGTPFGPMSLPIEKAGDTIFRR